MTLVTFSLKNVHYSIDVTFVEEVIPLPAITPVAKLPSFFCGVINLRGCAVPIIELRKWLDLEVACHELSNDIIVIKVDKKIMGLIVDKVLSVVDIQDHQIIPPPTMHEDIDIKYISGVVQLDSRLSMLIDLEEILNMADRSLACIDLKLSEISS